MTDDPNDSIDDGASTTIEPSRRRMLSTLLGASALAGAGLDAGTGRARGAPGDHSAALGLVPTDRVTHTATASGNWDDPGTWDAGVPGTDARVHIPAGTTVTLAGETARLHWLRVDGTYRVDPTTDSHLRVETVVTGESSRFEVGTETQPIQAGVTAGTTFLDRGPIDTDYDPGRRGRGLLTLGEVDIHGTAKTEWNEVATFPKSGDNQLELMGAPEGWRAGDRVVVAPVEEPDNAEVETVRDVSGLTVGLVGSLNHDHVPPEDDLPVHVANLTRNVRFESENTDVPRRGHLMFMTEEGVVVESAGMYGLGRTDKSRPLTNPQGQSPPGSNPKARYALHFHKTGVDRSRTPHEVHGCAVDGSPGWGIVNHHSYVTVTDCVSYDVLGAGFVTEGGDEQGTFKRNIAIKSEGSGQNAAYRANEGGIISPAELSIDDFGHAGHGFWMHSPGTVVEDNVAAGHADFGFFYWGIPLDEAGGIDRGSEHYIRFGVMVPANYPKEYGTFNRNDANSSPGAETDTHIAQGYVTIRSFTDNTAYAVGSGVGLRWMKPQHHSGQKRHTNYEDYNKIERFTAYGIHREGESPFTGGNGIALTWSSHVWIDDCRLVGTGHGRGINRGIDLYAISNVMVQDSDVRGFQVGVCASPGPEGIIAGCTLDNERTNVRSLAGEMHKNSTLWLHNNTYRGADHNLFRHFIIARHSFVNFFGARLNPDSSIKFLRLRAKNNVRLDDQKLYFDFQLPDVKPFQVVNEHGRVRSQESELAVARRIESDFADEFDSNPRVPDEASRPENLVGLTNRQLDEKYGLKAAGSMVPEAAERTDFVRRAWVAPAEGTDVDVDSDTMPPELPGMALGDAPAVDIEGPTTAGPGSELTFRSSVSDPGGGTVEEYEWSVEDSTETGAELTHTFAEAGRYTVALSVTTGDGRTATATQDIDVATDGRDSVTLRVENGTVDPDGTTRVAVTADPIPDGLAAVSLTVSVDDTGVATIRNGTPAGEFSFSDVDVSDGRASVKILDDADVIQPDQPDATIATLEVAGSSQGTATLSLGVESMTDDTGESVRPSVEAGTVTVDPTIPPVEDGLAPPRDPDGDGDFEDVNGNGNVEYSDVVALSDNAGSDPIASHADAFDFAGGGNVDSADLMALLEEL